MTIMRIVIMKEKVIIGKKVVTFGIKTNIQFTSFPLIQKILTTMYKHIAEQFRKLNCPVDEFNNIKPYQDSNLESEM